MRTSPWFKVDDNFWSHPKISELSNDAISLWVRAGSYSAQHLTDGFVSGATVSRQLWASSDAAGELVACGLWDEESDGFRFHDWLEYQPSASSTLEKAEAARERMRKAREKRHGTFDDRSREHPANAEGTFDDRSRSVRLTPTPSPTPSPSSNEEDNKPRKRGHRLPDGFGIDDEMRAWASQHVPSLDIDAVLPEFVDYWSSQPGQKGVKTDWAATWRNGMRKQAEWKSRGGRQQPAKQPAMNRALDEFQRLYGGETDGGAGSVRALGVGSGS